MQITIHGHGSISAAGIGPADAWQTYTGNRPTWRVDAATGLPVYRTRRLPAEDEIARYVAETRADRATHLALRAARQAVTEAGWHGKEFAILAGCSRGPTGSWEASFGQYRTSGTVGPRTSPETTLGSIGFALARYFDTTTLASSLSVTCSSGFHALVHGVALLRAGMAERVLVGGTEAPLTPFTLRQLEAMRIYAVAPCPETHACRPLAASPSGMAIGEGAAFFALSLAPGDGPVIAGLSFARERATTPTGITRNGAALQRTMAAAIAEGGSAPDLVVAHAPGTRRGDAAERTALAALPGTGGRAPLTSGKWATGHTFGASGPLGLALALQVLAQGSAAALHYLPGPDKVRSVLVNATGFGGNAVSVLIR